MYLWAEPQGNSPSCHSKRLPQVLSLPGSHQQSRPQSRKDSARVFSSALLVTTAPPSPVVWGWGEKKLPVATSPKVPPICPFSLAPRASQLSSTSHNLCF